MLTPRLESYIDRSDLNGCWLWTGARSSSGYGYVGVGKGSDRRMLRAHRVVYELLVGPVPDGLVLDHLCRVKRCVNPRHLEPVTHRENVQRGMRTARRADWWEASEAPSEDRCRNGHARTPENTYVQATGKNAGRRTCRACKALAKTRNGQKKWASREKAARST